jgi:hypothetical protein
MLPAIALSPGTTSTTTTPTETTAAAASSTARFLRTRFIDRQGPAAHI